jgi:NitT/TauT family transport system substrate-binding protein
MARRTRHRRRSFLGLATAAGAVAALALFGGSAASAPQADTITLNGLPIANGFPLDLGIQKGFFSKRNIEIKKNTLQSGNDIVLALANRPNELGYVGYVPAIIGRTQGIPITVLAASDVEGTSVDDNWQNIMVRGDSSIRTVADLAGKTIAVNALKGVGEVMIKAALKKRGVDPNSVKLLAVPFTTMRTALRNGQVDAFWAPEPFVSQAINLDGARIVMAPGPVLGNYFPIGCYIALKDWTTKNADLANRFRAAMNESLTYAQSHPNEIRALLPAGTQNVRLPIWTTTLDRNKILQLARYMKEYGVINTLPNLTQLVPSSIASGLTLQAVVGATAIVLRLEGKRVTKLNPGKYTFVVFDRSAKQNFRLDGPGVHRQTSVRGIGRSTWTVTLKKGTYRYSSSASARLKRTFKVG